METRRSRWVVLGALAGLLVAVGLLGISHAGQAGQPTPPSTVDVWGEKNATVIKVGTTVPLQSPYWIGMRAMAPLIEDMTRGRYKFEYYPSSQLGGERDLAEGVKLGTMKMTIVSTGPLSAFNPMIKLVDLPYLFTSSQQAYRVLDGPIGHQILDEFEKSGLHAFGLV